MKVKLSIVLFIFLGITTHVCAQKQRSLFNGKDLTGWTIHATEKDHPIIQLKDEKIGQGQGFIALQIHDGGGIRVRWKNLKIREFK